MTQIVQVNVSQTIAPAPNKLQRTGAFISQGGTNLPPNSKSLLTQLSDLTPLLAASQAITSLVWATNVVTVTTTAPHGYPNGDLLQLTIAGATPAGFNGTFMATVTGASTFTYPLTTSPGTATVMGTVTDADVAQLTAMTTTYFAQGNGNPVYVLELGAGTAAEGVTALTAYITNTPNFFYSYLVPRGWDAEPTYVAMVANYESTSAKVYFFTTATLTSYASFTALMKCTFMLIEAPIIPSKEFSLAAAFWVTLNYNPSPANQVTPLCFSYLVGVTPYPVSGPQAATFKAANLGYVTTGAEGGISNAMLVWGHMADGNPFNYWYSVDWAQINLDLNLSNEIINGSNNPINPLYYNQQGIDRLQARARKTMASAVSYGLALGNVITTELDQTAFVAALDAGTYAGNVVINAIPFANYNSLNPSDYAIGKYAGLSAVYTPARGFEQIIFNLNVTNFVA